LLTGRYGPYVTDGETNASLSGNLNLDELTFDIVLDLLAKRAAKGPVTRRRKVVKKVKDNSGTSTPKKAVKKATKKTVKKATKKTTKKATGKVVGKTVKKSATATGKTVKKRTVKKSTEE